MKQHYHFSLCSTNHQNTLSFMEAKVSACSIEPHFRTVLFTYSMWTKSKQKKVQSSEWFNYWLNANFIKTIKIENSSFHTRQICSKNTNHTVGSIWCILESKGYEVPKIWTLNVTLQLALNWILNFLLLLSIILSGNLKSDVFTINATRHTLKDLQNYCRHSWWLSQNQVTTRRNILCHIMLSSFHSTNSVWKMC